MANRGRETRAMAVSRVTRCSAPARPLLKFAAELRQARGWLPSAPTNACARLFHQLAQLAQPVRVRSPDDLVMPLPSRRDRATATPPCLLPFFYTGMARGIILQWVATKDAMRPDALPARPAEG